MTQPDPKPPTKQKIKKPGRWRRRTIWTLGILIVLGIVLRMTLLLALPMVLRKVAGNFGMTCNYDRLELNLFSGDAGIWGLEFKPREGGPAILAADYCHGNVSVLNLFRGKLNVWRVEADGVEANIDRNPDGRIPLLDRFVNATSTPSVPSAKQAPGEMNLSSPLRVDALRLDHIRVHIHDRGVVPEIDTEMAMDLRLSDLGSPTHPAKFEMNLSADPLLDTMRVSGEGQSSGKNLDATVNVLVRGIRLKPAAAYLAPLGIRPISDAITLTAHGHVHTAPAPNNAEGFTASLAFDHLSALADRQEALALDSLAIDSGVIDTRSIRIERCVLDGARAFAGRAANGNFQIAGIEYDPTLITNPPPPKPPSPTPPLLLELMKEKWSVGVLGLTNARLDFHDQGVSPAVDLSLIADELSADSIDHDPANLQASVTLKGRVRAPGFIRDIRLDGTAVPFADEKKFSVTMTASGIKPDAIKPYLDLFGIESLLKNASFTAAANATLTIGDTVTAGAKVTRFEFADDQPLLALADVSVSKVVVNPTTGSIDVGDVEVTGPGISIVRDSTGQFSALGFRTKPARVPVAAEPLKLVVAANPAPFTLASLPKITLGKFRWSGTKLDLEDQSVAPATKIAIDEIGVEATGLSTDPDAKSAGQFKAWLSSPQVVKRLDAGGILTPVPDGIQLDSSVSGSGLNLLPFAAYLKPLGIQPTLRDGSIAASGRFTLKMSQAGASVSVDARDVQLRDGLTVLASLAGLRLDNGSAHGNEISAQQILIERPHIAVSREQDGSLAAIGFRLLPKPKSEPGFGPPVTTVVSPAVDQSASTAPLELPVVSVPMIKVIDASIDWTDLAVVPNVKTTATAQVQLHNLLLRKDPGPTRLDVHAKVADVLNDLSITGSVTLDPDRQAVDLDVAASGLRAGPLVAYFPPGIESSVRNGNFHTKLTAEMGRSPQGGFAAEMTAGPLDFRDDALSLLHLDSAHIKIPRIDLPDTALAIDEISVQALTSHAEKLPAGELAFGGLLIGGKTPQPHATPLPVAATPLQISPVPAATMPPTTGPTPMQLLAASRRVFPEVTVRNLDLNVAKFVLTDLSRPASEPLLISNLRLHNPEPIDWLGKNPEGKPPTKLQLTCRIAPLADQVLVDVVTSPFARQPHVHVDFNATGVHGDGLTRLMPELKDRLDGSAMSNGSLTAHLGIEATLDRRNALDFDVSHGFDLNFVLSKVQYRSHPDGPVLAGVDEIRGESIRIVPADSIVHVKTLEITQPIGRITRDQVGVHALGWTYKFPSDTATPASTQPVVASKSDASGPSVEVPSAKPVGEIRIDKLLISGLDFAVEDHAVNPPLMIPLNGLDVEVRNLSSLAPYEDRPIRFSALVNAGKVSLPVRGSNPPVMEQRDLFSQITANGDLSLYPNLHGWAKTSVSGLDLADLQGEAAQFNETLTSGIYDSEVDMKFDPNGSIAINSHFTLTDLSLSEPPNGLIARTLHLPAPLDVVIGAVETQDKSITLPIPVTLDPKHISYLDLAAAGAAGITDILASAVAAAPMKAVDDFGGLIGLGGSDKPQDLTTTVNFFAGSAAFGPAQTAEISELLVKLHDDPSLSLTLKSTVGADDLTILSVRANPTHEQSENLEANLRLRKAELLRLRSDAAGKARADLASVGSTAAGPAIDRLRAIDREIDAADQSLDQVGDLLKPGAERLTQRRTRAAVLKVAGERLTGIRAALVEAGIPADRIRVTTAQFNPSAQNHDGQVVIQVVKKR